MKYISLLLGILILSGCGCSEVSQQHKTRYLEYRDNFMKIEYGMSDSEVREILGEPKHVKFTVTDKGKFVIWDYVANNGKMIQALSFIEFKDSGHGNLKVESVDFNGE